MQWRRVQIVLICSLTALFLAGDIFEPTTFLEDAALPPTNNKRPTHSASSTDGRYDAHRTSSEPVVAGKHDAQRQSPVIPIKIVPSYREEDTLYSVGSLTFSSRRVPEDPNQMTRDCLRISEAVNSDKNVAPLQGHPFSTQFLPPLAIEKSETQFSLKDFAEKGYLCQRRFADMGTFPESVVKRQQEAHQLRRSDVLRQLFECPSLMEEALRPHVSYTSSTNNGKVEPGNNDKWKTEHSTVDLSFRDLNWKKWVSNLPRISTTTEKTVNDFSKTSVFRRVPKHGSWVYGDYLYATCEQRSFFSDKVFPFFFFPNHTCVMVLWTSGTPDANSIGKLKSYSRKGRNAIFKEREGTFVYGGAVSERLRSTIPIVQVRGTSILNGAFAVDNVGHVIHDALWALQVALAAPDTFPKVLEPISPFKDSFQMIFGQDFTRVSSAYYGLVSSLLGLGEESSSQEPMRQTKSVQFPLCFEEGKCMLSFDRLLLPGQDRHLDGGGAGLRQSTALRLRQHVFEGIQVDANRRRRHRPQILIYGRNDVHRRSIDNMQALFQVATNIAQQLQLPPPVIIDTFSRPVVEQIAIMSAADVMLSIQGSHQQNSLFMPEDAVIVEIAPCRAHRVSFLQRYGPYLKTHAYWYAPLCDGVLVNYCDPDPVSQNVTLCPSMTRWIQDKVLKMVQQQIEGRATSG